MPHNKNKNNRYWQAEIVFDEGKSAVYGTKRENLKDCVPELNTLINTYAHNGVSFVGIKKYYGK